MFKKKGVIHGASGLLSYKMSDCNTIAMMFSVPYVHLRQSGMSIYTKDTGKWMSTRMMSSTVALQGKPFEGNEAWHEKHLPFGYHVEGIMSGGNQGVNINLMITKSLTTTKINKKMFCSLQGTNCFSNKFCTILYFV